MGRAMTRAERQARRERLADEMAKVLCGGALLREAAAQFGFSRQYASRVLAEFYDIGLLMAGAHRARRALARLPRTGPERPRPHRRRKPTPPMAVMLKCRKAGMAWAAIALASGLPASARHRLRNRTLEWARRCGLPLDDLSGWRARPG